MFKVRSPQSALAAYKDELIAIVLLAVVCFLGISFFSYHPQDPSLLYYSSLSRPVHNLGGILGAQVAALFFYFLGASAFFILPLLLFYACLLLFNIPLSQEWERLLAGSLLIGVSATLCSIYQVDFLRATCAGGLVGHALHKAFVALFGLVGGVLCIHTLLLICLIVLVRFSFMGFVRWVMQGLQILVNKERFLKPAYAVTTKIVATVLAPFAWLYSTGKKLYQGSIVSDEEYAVADFESQVMASIDEADNFNEMWQNFNPNQVQPQPQEYKAALLNECQNVHVEQAQPVHNEPSASVLQEVSELQPDKKLYALPDAQLFVSVDTHHQDAKLTKELEARAKILEEKLERFGVYGQVTSIKRGPVVTLFEYQPQIDTKISKILALEDDLSLALQAMSIRILAPIPGRSVVGFEVANQQRKDVLFAHVIKSAEYAEFKGQLPLVLGQDTVGNNVVVDLVSMPHLLVAGSTGSGKSVALNAMLISLLCKRNPDELKLILIDPKRLEFAAYADVAHLIFPIITDPKRATMALRWVVKQMEERYEAMAKCGARNVADYNRMVGRNEKAVANMPFIVVVIDELADLMMTASKDIEDLIARIAQMARAAGIHLLVATQRPSVDVITGLIKVNFPSRISFRVTSKIDSRTILDCGGADKLLGRGDMLFLDAAGSSLRRVHGAYVSDKEIAHVVDHIKAEQAPRYLDLIEELPTHDRGDLLEADNQIFQDIKKYVQEVDEVSISLLQRKFRIGFNRSARIIDQLESQGLIMPADGGKTRKVIH